LFISFVFPAEVCTTDDINVTHRTSTMFTALVTYNCSSINSSELFIFPDDNQIIDCNITQDFPEDMTNSAVTVTCNNIEKNAGRDWTFILGPTLFDSQIILNQTFSVTLEPLSLSTSTNISTTIHDDLSSASFLIDNCTEIVDPKYLVFRCNTSDLSNKSLSSNCTYTCYYLEPGSIYNASLVRLPVPIVDKANDTTFEEEIIYQNYEIGNHEDHFSFSCNLFSFQVLTK
jgi:hypothetical protein